MRRPQFTLRALLVLLLAVACFFGGIRFERERQRREDEAAARAAGGEASERLARELFLQEQKVDALMTRFNALMAEERRLDKLRSTTSETDQEIRNSLKKATK